MVASLRPFADALETFRDFFQAKTSLFLFFFVFFLLKNIFALDSAVWSCEFTFFLKLLVELGDFSLFWSIDLECLSETEQFSLRTATYIFFG